MLDYKKIPIWKPGDYDEILRENLKFSDAKFDFNKIKQIKKLTEKDENSKYGLACDVKFELNKVNIMKKLSEKGGYSKYGLSYDMHVMHRMIGGAMKTLVMRKLEE